jgi:hypothetical protein
MNISTLLIIFSGYCAALPANCILVNANTVQVCSEAYPKKLTRYKFVREDNSLIVYVGRCPQT